MLRITAQHVYITFKGKGKCVVVKLAINKLILLTSRVVAIVLLFVGIALLHANVNIYAPILL